MYDKLMDIETLLTELRNVNDQDHCIDCKKFSQCYKHDVGAFNEESYCKELLEQACLYLKDSSELKCLIEGCMSGEITCNECNIDIGHYRSCLRYMIGETYERLSQWTNDKLKDMDLNTLCKELDYLSKINCSECQNPECSSMIFGKSYCSQLLLHACKYLDDEDELKKLIEGCFDDNLACIDCELDGKHESCTVYMMTQAYERLATWRIN